MCDSVVSQRSSQHSPELLPIMEIELLLAICPGEGVPRVTLVELKSDSLPHNSILILPIMSSWRFSEVAALMLREFCNLVNWKQGNAKQVFTLLSGV